MHTLASTIHKLVVLRVLCIVCILASSTRVGVCILSSRKKNLAYNLSLLLNKFYPVARIFRISVSHVITFTVLIAYDDRSK